MTRTFIFDRGDLLLPESAAALLPPWRRERFVRLRREEARQESLAAGLLYRRAMTLWGADPGAEVVLLPAGKPVLAGREDLYFSLSHSGRYVLCAVSDLPVGADVQECRPLRTDLTRWFHPGEQAWLAEQEDREAALYRLWTRKEAWVKAVSGETMLSLGEADVLHDLPGLWFRDIDLPGDYAAAVCAGEEEIGPPEPVFRRDLLDPLEV